MMPGFRRLRFSRRCLSKQIHFDKNSLNRRLSLPNAFLDAVDRQVPVLPGRD
jgi:hypothetical protein